MVGTRYNSFGVNIMKKKQQTKNNTKKCYIYTRVSTEMQKDGYSIDAQKEAIKNHAKTHQIAIIGEYSDVASGKSVEGREDFQRMMQDIRVKKDNVDYVIVFKLSRFGRNVADVLNSLREMQKYKVNLISVEDCLDSSKSSGKFMIAILAAVAEMERDNISIQTLAGRYEKARQGLWNGGFAPYGYKLVKGKLQIAKDEEEVIKVIFEQYTTTNKGLNGVAKYLNNNGYKKKIRQNGTLPMFSASFVKAVIDNPVYCGKIAYGRRKTEKIDDEESQYHVVKQDDAEIVKAKGKHKAIISEAMWKEAQKKRKMRGVKYEKKHSLDHANILSGILKCPRCGASMYGNVNRKKKKDGTYYKDYFYYACKHRIKVDGHVCDYKRQWGQDKIDNAVAEIICKLVQNSRFEQAIKEKINSKIDTSEIERELEILRKEHKKVEASIKKLSETIDSLDIYDSMYDRKYEDFQNRLFERYESLESIEIEIDEVEQRLENVQQNKIKGDKVYEILQYFDKVYEKLTDFEKKELIGSFLESVEIYEEEQESGQILKSLKFKFPIYFNDSEVSQISWDNESHVETVVLMSRK